MNYDIPGFGPLRELEVTDYTKHYPELLAQLAPVTAMPRSGLESLLRRRKEAGIMTWVLEKNERIIATISLFLEQKLYRGGRAVGHIEDVIVDNAYRHASLGTELLKAVQQYARAAGCYKVILDCKQHFKPFYQRSGFTQHNMIQMQQYFEEGS